jgi:hypothetical protein
MEFLGIATNDIETVLLRWRNTRNLWRCSSSARLAAELDGCRPRLEGWGSARPASAVLERLGTGKKAPQKRGRSISSTREHPQRALDLKSG